MSIAQQPPAERLPLWLRAICALGVVVLTAAVGLKALEAGKLELIFLLLAAAASGLAIVYRPNWSIYLALFLLYTNAPVIAKRLHGVPHPIVFIIPLLLMIPIAVELLRKREPIVLPKVLIWITGFLMVQALGALWSRDPATALDGVFISVTEGVLLFLLIVNAVRTEKVLRGAVWALLAAGAFLGAASAHQYATKSYHKDYGGFAQVQGKGFGVQGERIREIQHRAAGPLGVENRYAQIMLMLLPLGLFRYRDEPDSRGKWLALGAIGLTMIGWALAFSRGSAVGLVLTAIVMMSMGYLRARQIAVVGVVALLLLIALPQYRTRLASLKSLRSFAGQRTSSEQPDGAITGRATEMLAATWVYLDHPLLGVGPTMFRYYAQEYGRDGGLKALDEEREAHCLYVAIAAEAGTLGLVMFFGAILATIRDLTRIRAACAERHPRLAALATGFLLMIVVYLTTGVFAHFSFVRYFWTMMALATACVCVASRVVAEDDRREEGA